jgi:flavin-dependent dehydrogenase
LEKTVTDAATATATPPLSTSDAPWDAVVIGAGPAGALAAQQLAGRGLRTLVVDAKRFPRSKVCGGCLNRRGVTALDAAGLKHVLGVSQAARVTTLHWIVGAERARFALPEMRVVDRAAFDLALVEAARRAGATFWDGTPACVEPALREGLRTLAAPHPSGQFTIQSRVVICADGLARSSVKRLPEFGSLISSRSRIGVGATVEYDGPLARDEIAMIVGRPGYVGLARSGDRRLNVAAALDPAWLARSNASELIADMLRDAGLHVLDDWSHVSWHGTPPLTGRPNRVAAERLFVIGDASGYVEPFSGEGMATALQSALAVAPLAVAAARDWRSSLVEEWTAVERRLVVDQQSTCRQLAWMLRRPLVAAMALRICRVQPWVAQRFIAKVS